jgi:hypothetical protein
MFNIALRWPSGFIYARHPQQTFGRRMFRLNHDETSMFSCIVNVRCLLLDIINDYDLQGTTLLDCTTELRASIGDRIRIVFYPISRVRNDYDHDYDVSVSKGPCLKIRDVRH